MKRFTYEKELESPEINLTPLLDVVFVILIMFIVVVPLLEVDRVELASGGAQEKSSATSHQISLYVYKDNSLMLNGKIISLEELQPYLAVERKKSSQEQLTLFHDREASFGTYQAIKEIAEAAGFRELDVILKPKQMR